MTRRELNALVVISCIAAGFVGFGVGREFVVGSGDFYVRVAFLVGLGLWLAMSIKFGRKFQGFLKTLPA